MPFVTPPLAQIDRSLFIDRASPTKQNQTQTMWIQLFGDLCHKAPKQTLDTQASKRIPCTFPTQHGTAMPLILLGLALARVMPFPWVLIGPSR